MDLRMILSRASGILGFRAKKVLRLIKPGAIRATAKTGCASRSRSGQWSLRPPPPRGSWPIPPSGTNATTKFVASVRVMQIRQPWRQPHCCFSFVHPFCATLPPQSVKWITSPGHPFLYASDPTISGGILHKQASRSDRMPATSPASFTTTEAALRYSRLPDMPARTRRGMVTLGAPTQCSVMQLPLR